MANPVTVSASEDQHRYALKLFQEGHYKEAAGALGEILKSLETSQIWSDWATAQLMCGRAAESEQGYRRALEISPANDRATGNLGVLLARTGRTAEAVPFLERAAAGSSEAERAELLRLAQVCRNQISVSNETKSRSTADLCAPMSRSADLPAEAASNVPQPPGVAEPWPDLSAHPPDSAASTGSDRVIRGSFDLTQSCVFAQQEGRPVLSLCNERIVEIPFVHRHLPYPFTGRVLDVGSHESLIAFEVSSLGFESWAIDSREEQVKFPGVRFVRGDIRSTSFDQGMFDVVIALSTLEHIGLTAYQNEDYDESGDAHALLEIHRILKPDGRLLLTIPFGICSKNNWYRVYDHFAVHELLAACGFTPEVGNYWWQRGLQWEPACWQEAEKVDSLSQGVKAVACFVARPASGTFEENELSRKSLVAQTGKPSNRAERSARAAASNPDSLKAGATQSVVMSSSADASPRQAPQALDSHSAAGCKAQAGIYFQGIVYGGSGYAEEAWVEALSLSEHQIPVQLAPVGHTSDKQRLLPEAARSRLEALQSQTVDLSRSVFYQAAMAHLWDMDTYGRCRVVRTMFETDRVPDGVPERCNAMDEVWVPSRFNLETYARAGVDERKLRLVPAGVDTQLFRPGLAPLRIPQKRGFNFLSVFDWQHRKGYDALLLAYLREFKPDEDVALILKVYQMNDAVTDLQAKIIYFAEREAGVPLEKGAPIILVNGFLPQKDMPRLYAAGNCFVLPTHGEGYGRPFLEALSCAVPVISTGWSGQMDFLTNENSYLIDYQLAPVPSGVDVEMFVGHQWAEPDVDHLRQLMRQAFSHREEACKRGERGRADIVERYDWGVIMPRWVAEFQRLLN